MSEDIVTRLALESGLIDRAVAGKGGPPDFQLDYASITEEVYRFASLVAEQCAKECEELAFGYLCPVSGGSDLEIEGARACAAAIRARFVHSSPAALSQHNPRGRLGPRTGVQGPT